MAKIGSYGDIVFEVSEKKTQTFKDFQRSGPSRWEDHNINLSKPISEFLGPDLDSISIIVNFKAELGVNPIKQVELLRMMRDTGKVSPFVIGDKPISNNYWSIRQIEENHRTIDNKGNVLNVESTLTLKEYLVRPIKKKATVKTTSTQVSSNVNKKMLGKMTITVKSVHIRSAPSTKGKVLGYAFKGNILTVYSEKDGWYSLGNGRYITANSKYSSLKKG